MDKDVLGRSSLCEAFKGVLDKEKLENSFKEAYITRLFYHQTDKKIILALELHQEIRAAQLSRLEKALSDFFKAQVQIKPDFAVSLTDKLSDWHLEMVKETIAREKGHMLDFLEGADYSLSGKNLCVTLTNQTSEMLLASGVGKCLEEAFKSLFGKYVEVSFNNCPIPEHKAVDYMTEKMENEARVVAEVLSAPPPPKTGGSGSNGKGSYNGQNGSGRNSSSSNGGGYGNGGYSNGNQGNGGYNGGNGQNGGYGSPRGGKGGRAPSENNPRLIYGRGVRGNTVRMVNVDTNSGLVVVEGQVLKVEEKELKSGRILITFDVTDFSSSITIKLFPREDDLPVVREKLVKGKHLKVNGEAQYDMYAKELVMLARDIELIEVELKTRTDDAPVKRVELHLHSQMSQLDAITPVKDLINRAAKWGHKAVALTDHGVVQGFPEAQDVSEGLKKKQDKDIKILYGIEAYLIAEERMDAKGLLDYKNCDTFHAVILVRNQTGLKNLYRIVSESHLNYFYKKPRIPWSLFSKYREGLIIGTACEAGELFQAILRNRPEEEIIRIAERYDYLEIQPTGNNGFLVREGRVADEEGLKDLNRRIVALGDKMGKPVVATCDVHFLDPDDAVYREILQTGQGYKDASRQAPIFLRTTEEMLEEFAYLGEEKAYEVVVTNTVAIADSIEKVIPIPSGTFPPHIEGAEDDIKRMSEEKVASLYGEPLPELVRARVDRELGSIIKNGFSVMYMIAQKLVKKSLDEGYLVGSRGSVGSSFVAYLIGITEVNSLPAHYRCGHCLFSEFFEKDKTIGCGFDLPEKNCPRCGQPLIKDGYDIPFETFLGFDGDKEPDIDLNFSGEYQPRAHKYTEELFGEGYTFRAGTIATIAEKTAFGFVKKYLDEKNVVGTRAEIERLASGCTGIKRTTGQHPGGVMVVPHNKEIYDFCPIQRPADDTGSNIITTHFDYHSISGRILKLDILGHDDPTVIRMLEDLTGVDAQSIPIGEKKTMGIFSSTEPLEVSPESIDSLVGTFGVPEFGTKFVRQMLVDTMPSTFAELIRISGLSHGTDVWLNNAQELVRAGVTGLAEVISTRDDIMVYLMKNDLPPLTAFKIMESVRKGKGLSPEQEELMKDKGVPDWYIQSCKKIKYMFPKAHAAAYVMMAFRIAWFKVYYPEAFYATYFSVRADTFDANIISKGPDSVKEAIEDIEAKGNNATQKEKDLLTILEVAREMYARKIKCLPVSLYNSEASRFQITDDGILPPFTALQGLGEAAAKNIVEARKEGEFVSIEDLKMKSGISKAVIEIMEVHGCLKGMDASSQLTLF